MQIGEDKAGKSQPIHDKCIQKVQRHGLVKRMNLHRHILQKKILGY